MSRVLAERFLPVHKLEATGELAERDRLVLLRQHTRHRSPVERVSRASTGCDVMLRSSARFSSHFQATSLGG